MPFLFIYAFVFTTILLYTLNVTLYTRVNGYTNEMSVQHIDDSVIKHLEQFAQNILEYAKETQNEELPESQFRLFLGYFSKNPGKFSVPIGHKQTLKSIASHLNGGSCSNPEEHTTSSSKDKHKENINKKPNLVNTIFGMLFNDSEQKQAIDDDASQTRAEALELTLTDTDEEYLRRKLDDKLKERINCFIQRNNLEQNVPSYEYRVIFDVITNENDDTNQEVNQEQQSKVNNIYAMITCFCGSKIKCFYGKQWQTTCTDLTNALQQKRQKIPGFWICSNFQKHLLSHSDSGILIETLFCAYGVMF